MKKNAYYRQDWFIALLVGIAFGVVALVHGGWLERPELGAYDIGVQLTHRTLGAGDDVVIVAIDDASIRDIGRWPWPRGVLADVLTRLAKAKPRAVGVLLDLSEPQVDRGLVVLREIEDKLDAMKVPRAARAQVNGVRTLLRRAQNELDDDRLLARALDATPRLYLPMHVDLGVAADAPPVPAPDYVQRYRFVNVVAPPVPAAAAPTEIRAIQAPRAAFARHARGIGYLRFRPDPDAGARVIYTALAHDGKYYPSLPLLLAASDQHLDVRHMTLDVGVGVRIGRLFVPLDAEGRTAIGFYSPPAGKRHAFPTYSFRDVRAEKLPLSLFTNKVVLLGLTAADAGARFVTPITPQGSMSEPELAANAVAGILNQDFYTTPRWAKWVRLGASLAVLLYLTVAMPRMRLSIAALASLLLLIGLLGAEQFLMVSERLWLPAVTPALLLGAGYVGIAAKRLLLGDRRRIEAETDSIHSNRMLGLTFQSQGQLDMAMDKFRKLPVDESVLDLVYGLALDFERKRQFHKAAAAYDYILGHDAGFRDCRERVQRARQGDQSVIALGTLILDGAEKPTIGRYHIEREIGRGAMGVVYLGRDPKINRQVAIKTLALAQDFEPNAVAGARERFFREAQTAGQLHHPNIVTIYDVGEDHDLAYIAMEYLEGSSLAAYVESKEQLAFDWILDVAIKVADALAYAHASGVVHRDIKPHNIVYHEAAHSVKVMDFGIARVTAANSTKTGVVLGTPSYMSPEQISGKRVDRRSDLFSFGSMLFEMIAGETPFGGDSFAALTHQIINAPTPDVRKFRADTPARLVAIVRRLLQKKVTKRYQDADELRRDLETCRSEVADWNSA